MCCCCVGVVAGVAVTDLAVIVVDGVDLIGVGVGGFGIGGVGGVVCCCCWWWWCLMQILLMLLRLVPLKIRRANNGVSRYPSYQKIFQLAEYFRNIYRSLSKLDKFSLNFLSILQNFL